jgi:hypothetical protein
VLDMQWCQGVLDATATRELLRAPVFRTLDTFAAPNNNTKGWITAFPETEVRAIELVIGWLTLRLERDPAPYLAIHIGRHVTSAIPDIVGLPRWWPRDVISRVRLVVDAEWNDHPEDRAKLLEAARAIDPDATLATSP